MSHGGGKRKRQDRHASSQDDNHGRPSPHKPENLNLAQQAQRNERPLSGRGRGRGNTGGQAAVDDQAKSHEANRSRRQSHIQDNDNRNSSPRAEQATTQHSRPASSRPDTQAQGNRPQSPPRALPQFFTFDYITDDVVKGWREAGQATLTELLAGSQDAEILGGWLQELIQSVLTLRLDAEAAGRAFATASSQRASNIEPDLQAMLVDVVTLGTESDWQSSAFLTFVKNTGISADVWRIALEPEALIAIGLVKGPAKAFTQARAKKMTNLLYRQANYNLLREESEGYAKLITEYFNTAMTANALESAPTLAEDAFQRVKALIGAFDLDVSRVLDITLDVFANLLVRNFRFFVKYIRASAWWPDQNLPDAITHESDGLSSLPGWALPGAADWGLGSEEVERIARDEPLKLARDVKFWERVAEHGLDAFCDLSARRITNYDEVVDLLAPLNGSVSGQDKSRDKDELKRRRINDARQWMRETKTLPPRGNADAAQLLGFKLSFYASPARDESDVMPDNLIFLTALLIKIGFISLRDLYPHLYPSDEKFAELKTRFTEEQAEKDRARRPGGAARNALAIAGALSDDNTPSAPVAAVKAIKDGASSKAASPRPDGAATPRTDATEAEKLPEPPNQKLLLLKSLLAIGALPEALFILGKFPWLADLVSDLPDYVHRILHHMLAKIYEPLKPLPNRNDLDEQKALVGTQVGAAKGTLIPVPAPPRVTKRWANLDRPDMGDGFAYKFYWDEWADSIPACRSVDDVFLLCNTFLNVTGVKIGKDPSLLLKLARIGKHSLAKDRSPSNESRWIDLLKRLLVPALSLTHRNPGVVNEVFDILKFFSTETRYSIYTEWHFGPISRLPDMRRAFDYTRSETRDVLKRLSKTNARAMGKTLAKAAYESPGIVLQTAISQMESYANLISVFVECSRYFTDLGYDVLTWCLLNALGGASRNRIQADGMLTSAWLRALSNFAGAVFKKYSACDPTPVLMFIASELLDGDSTDLELIEQIITGMSGIKSDMTYNDAQILAMAGGDVLRSQTIITMGDERHLHEKSSKRLIRSLTDAGLATQLLISIAQERQMYTYRATAKYAPLKVLGNNVDKIHQVLVQFLDLLQTNPSSEAFLHKMPDIFSLLRDYHLAPETAFMIGRAKIARKVAEVNTVKKEEHDTKQSTPKAKTNGDVPMPDADDITKTSGPPDVEEPEPDVKSSDDASTQQPKAVEPFWHPALSSLIHDLPQILGDEISSTLSMPFYATFWTLSLQDIVVNTGSYDQELATQTALQNQTKSDRTDPSVAGQQERDRKVKAIAEVKEQLSQEMKKQIGAYTQVRNRLIKEKDHWFQDFHNKIDMLHTSLLQNCFLPRVSVSSLDAHYSFTMLKFLHNNGTPGFRTMHFYDRLLRKNQTVSLIFASTVLEAENFGRFLNETLKDLAAWHADKATYEKSAFGAKRQLPGFARKMSANQTPETFLDYEDFRNLLWKWHSNLNGAFKKCFDSKEYMHIRNAIIVLKSVHQYFPAVNFMGQGLLEKMEELKKDERSDIKLAATSLQGNLKRREKSWMLPQAFRVNEVATAGRAGTSTPKSGSPAPQQSASAEKATTSAPTLNAKAAVFQPIVSDDANGEPPKSAVTEDGEIHDEHKARLPIVAASQKGQKPGQANMEAAVNNTTESNPRPPQPIQILKRPDPDRASQAASNERSKAGSAEVTKSGARPAATRLPSQEPKSQPVSARRDVQRSPRSDSRTGQRNSSQDRQKRTGDAADRDERSTRLDRTAMANSSVRASSRSRDRYDRSARNDTSLSSDRDRRPDPARKTEAQTTRSDGRDSAPQTRSDDAGRRNVSNSLGSAGRERDQHQQHSRDNDRERDRGARDRDRTNNEGGRAAEHPSSRASSRGRRDRSRERRPNDQNTNRQTRDTNQSSRDSELHGVNPARAAAIEASLRQSQAREPREQGRASQKIDTTPPSEPSTRSARDRDEGRRRSPRPEDHREPSQAHRDQTNRGREMFPEQAPSGPRGLRDDDRRPPVESSNFRRSAQSGQEPRDNVPSRGQQESAYGRLSAPTTPRVTPPQAQGAFSRSTTAENNVRTPVEDAAGADFVHPSRLAQLPRIDTQPGPVPTAPRSAGAASGPRDRQDVVIRDAPAGPSSAVTGGRGQDRRFAGLNEALQGGTDRGTSIRGRAGRASGPNMLPPPVPSGPSSPGMPDNKSDRTSGPGGSGSLSSRLGQGDARQSSQQDDRDRRVDLVSNRDDLGRRPPTRDSDRDDPRSRGDDRRASADLHSRMGSRDGDDRSRDGHRGQSSRDGGTAIRGASQLLRGESQSQQQQQQARGGQDGRNTDRDRPYRSAASDQPSRRGGGDSRDSGPPVPEDGRRSRGGRSDEPRHRDGDRDDSRRGGRPDSSRGPGGGSGGDSQGRDSRDGRKRRGDDHVSSSNMKRRRSGA